MNPTNAKNIKKKLKNLIYSEQNYINHTENQIHTEKNALLFVIHDCVA